MRPLLELLVDGHEHIVRDTYGQLADKFQLTEADKQADSQRHSAAAG